jgi:hypothetical protein
MLTTPIVARFHSSAASSAQPIFQTTHNLAPVFDGLSGFNVEFEGEKSNHAVVSG